MSTLTAVERCELDRLAVNDHYRDLRSLHISEQLHLKFDTARSHVITDLFNVCLRLLYLV